MQRINSSIIELMHMCTRPIKKNYTCKQNQDIVGFIEVNVDEKMKPVENFKCRTTDLETLVCSFRKPFGYLINKYRLHYTVGEGKVSVSVPMLALVAKF